MIGRIHFAGLIFALGAWAATVESPPKMRLADNARPLRYAVTLRLTPPSDTFEGTIDIDVSLRAPASTIWMHGTNLAVREAAIRSGGKSVPARAVSEGRDF